MATLVEVVYPSISSFSGTSQLNLGPYFVPSVKRLLRVEVHGEINFQGSSIGTSSVFANFQLWAVQWVPHGTAALDCVTTADGPQWPIRQQTGQDDGHATWSPSTDVAGVLSHLALNGWWAGQLAINGDIDLYLSSRAPTGVSVSNQNLFASLRFWWV